MEKEFRSASNAALVLAGFFLIMSVSVGLFDVDLVTVNSLFGASLMSVVAAFFIRTGPISDNKAQEIRAVVLGIIFVLIACGWVLAGINWDLVFNSTV